MALTKSYGMTVKVIQKYLPVAVIMLCNCGLGKLA